MLISVKLENFLSFDQLAEINMISSSKARKKPEHRLKIKQTSILKNAVIYGANAAGKSNFIEFFVFFKHVLNFGLPVESTQMFCKTKKENETRESKFEILFTVNDKFYAYGFSAILSKMSITGEWLYELLQDGGSNLLYKRNADNAINLSEHILKTDDDKIRFSVYEKDFSNQQFMLFLTEMNRNKNIEKKSKLIFFNSVFNWFINNIIIFTPNTILTNLEYYYDENRLTRLNKLIRTFDTGIDSVSIKEISIEELRNMLPKEIFETLLTDFKSKLKIAGRNGVKMSMRSSDMIFNMSGKLNEEPKISTISLRHKKSVFDFEFRDESDGTIRIFDLMDMLLTNKNDTVYIVDELERSLHPKLTERFLQLFMEGHQNEKVQLIFTTHEATIMTQELFRRDEIWFIERGSDNTSTISSLDRFKERYDQKLSKAYLAGRYGAVPVFSDFSFKEGG